MIAATRVLSQQLAKPIFDKPKDLVAWMGAMQAQDYNMVKWAVGVRMPKANLSDVNAALQRGEILRTHIMRPTWHLVVAEDIRWMLQLTRQRLKSTFMGYGKYHGFDEKIYTKGSALIEKVLRGNKSLSKQEVTQELNALGLKVNVDHTSTLLGIAEVDGLVCSGVDHGAKHTYALLEERVPPSKTLHKDEALARLAQKYFRSHSPATLNDFTWWSGLALTEARHAIDLIQNELIVDKFAGYQLLLHESCNAATKPDDRVYLLPPFDEYIISYKDRSTIMDVEHHPKAFTNNGIFHPTIMHKGKVIGRWDKVKIKGGSAIKASFFEPNDISNTQMKEAVERYKYFING